MKKTNFKERRTFVRAKRVLCIQYRKARKIVGAGKESSWGLSTTEDMSVGGLTFYSDCEYKVNDILEIHVLMSGILDIFKGYGKVIRVSKKKSGSYSLIAVKYIGKPC